jgi:hypothetical protein
MLNFRHMLEQFDHLLSFPGELAVVAQVLVLAATTLTKKVAPGLNPIG